MVEDLVSSSFEYNRIGGFRILEDRRSVGIGGGELEVGDGLCAGGESCWVGMSGLGIEVGLPSNGALVWRGECSCVSIW